MVRGKEAPPATTRPASARRAWQTPPVNPSAPSSPDFAVRTESLGRRVLVDATGYSLAALAVLLIALAGLRAGSWLFAREAILTRWR